MRIESFKTVTQVTFFPRLFPVNVYLVEEEDGLTLIDAGIPVSAKGILAAAAAIGKPIVRIGLTHAHSDHVGALDALVRQLPGVELAVSDRDARLLAGDLSLDPGEPADKLRGGLPKGLKSRPTRLLQPGDRLGSLEVIAAPGHTPGHVAYLDVRSRVLLAGDAFQVRGGVAVAGTMRPWFPFPAWATWHKPTALASAKALAALGPACLAVGHGRLLREPAQAMARAIAEAEARLAKGGSAHG
ncbi:MAG: MBL fold metallo-hydrolase [Clostridia bacterium]|nr:MBL fold metallo-hydrolase [Clostridia bacterium]